ncbi:MAG TPA: flagellar export chaperone FlgN [Mycobacteriales bacterium]|jgi:hypothetical protein|nr:flagellar export chaperone FlgN [Mycobacteriales bacterium]
MGLEAVSRILWKERELLELLLFKLEEEQLVLASGRTRWLAHATREVEAVLEEIRRMELLRSVEVDAAAADLGLSPGASLGALADAAPAPWDELLRSHRQTFLSLTGEIHAVAESNRELLSAGQRATRETLLSFGDGIETYTPSGTASSVAQSRRIVDEAV